MTFRRRTLTGLEVAFLDCSGRAFAKHAHDEFVIGANLSGLERIWLDGASLEAQTSDITLYNPGQVQASHAGEGPWAFVSLYVEPAWLEAQMGSSAGIWFDKAVPAAPGHADAIRRFGRSALQAGMSDEELIDAALLLLGGLVDAFTGARRPPQRRRLSHEAAVIRERLLEEMAAPPSLGELAALVGLAPVPLVRAFTRAYGLPPFQWLTVQRLARARYVLKQGNANLADLALELGFADQAHFTRRFAAIHGVTPAAYARG